MPALPEPTRQQQELAYRQLRRPSWPDTLDAALAQRTYEVCINAVARRLSRASACAGARPPVVGQPGAYVPPTPTAPPLPARMRLPNLAGRFDARRAAANDRDDD
jgi:hypothetical protein